MPMFSRVIGWLQHVLLVMGPTCCVLVLACWWRCGVEVEGRSCTQTQSCCSAWEFPPAMQPQDAKISSDDAPRATCTKKEEHGRSLCSLRAAHADPLTKAQTAWSSGIKPAGLGVAPRLKIKEACIKYFEAAERGIFLVARKPAGWG